MCVVCLDFLFGVWSVGSYVWPASVFGWLVFMAVGVLGLLVLMSVRSQFWGCGFSCLVRRRVFWRGCWSCVSFGVVGFHVFCGVWSFGADVGLSFVHV